MAVTFERISTDSSVHGGVPFVKGDDPVPVSAVVSVAAQTESIVEVLDRFPGLEREDVEQALLFAAQTVHDGGRPIDQHELFEAGAQELLVPNGMWPQTVWWLEHIGYRLAQIPSDQGRDPVVPSFVVVPGPGLEAIRQLGLPLPEVSDLVTELRATMGAEPVSDGRLRWEETVVIGADGARASTLSASFLVHPGDVSPLERVFMLGLHRAMREFRALRKEHDASMESHGNVDAAGNESRQASSEFRD